MKKSLHKLVLAALLCGGIIAAPKASALVEVQNYVEDFEKFVGGDPDCAPAYWMHFEPGMISGYFTKQETGGHEGGAYVNISDQCNPAYMTDNCLVSLPVKGEVSFWIKGASTSSVLEMYKMTYSNGKLVKGSSISKPTGFKMSTDWQKVTISKVEDYTRIGILLRKGGGIDDFTAENADKSDVVIMSVSNIVLPEKIVADTEGKATINVKFDLTNKGTSEIEAGSYSYKAGVCNYTGDALTTICETTADYPALAIGETKEINLSFEYILANPAVSESKSFAIENTLSGVVTRIATSKEIYSPAGVLNAKYMKAGSSTTLSNNGRVELGLLTAKPHNNTLTLTNSGNSPIVISDVYYGGDMEGAELPALPFTVAADNQPVDFSIPMPDATGAVNGTVTLEYSDGISDDKKFTYTVSSAILPEGAWIEDFQTCVPSYGLPQGWIVGDGQFLTVKADYTNPKSNIYANGSADNVSSLVTSKMHLEKGGAITLQGVRYNTSAGKKDALLTVYYSTDRENWVELGGILDKEPTRIPFNTYVASSSTSEWNWYNFSLKNVETGDYYVKFETAPYKIDNIFGMKPAEVDHDFMLGKFTANPKGEVNTALSAKLVVDNMNNKADGDFTITLYEDGEAVAEIEGEEIEAYGSQTFEMTYMPHKAGDVELTAEVTVAGNATLTSDPVTVAIAKEDLTGKITGYEITNYDKVGAWGLFGCKINKFQFVIPADCIGLKEGGEFSAISFKAYFSSYGVAKVPYTLWIEEVDEIAPFDATDKIDFVLPEIKTAVATGTYVLNSGESSIDAPADFIISLDKAITYGGKSYKVTFWMNADASADLIIGKHKFDENYCRYYGKNNETGTYPGGAISQNVPVVTFRYDQEAPTVSGTIHYGSTPVEGAEVKLIETVAKGRSVDASAAAVTYSGTTDADGRFSIPVIKSDRNYQLVAKVSDEHTYTHDAVIAPAGQNLELNTIETKLTPAGVEDISVEDNAGDAVYYNLQGIRVDDANLAPGIYIRSTSKGTTKILKK